VKFHRISLSKRTGVKDEGIGTGDLGAKVNLLVSEKEGKKRQGVGRI